MSREIKFRAWDNQENKWFKPTFEAYSGSLEELLLSMSGRLTIRTLDGVADESTFPDRFELVQFTGLLDKNGVDIYEGDLLSFGRDVIEILWWDAGFHVQIVGHKLPMGKMFEIHQRGEVIGNIYENPDLLTNKGESNETK